MLNSSLTSSRGSCERSINSLPSTCQLCCWLSLANICKFLTECFHFFYAGKCQISELYFWEMEDDQQSSMGLTSLEIIEKSRKEIFKCIPTSETEVIKRSLELTMVFGDFQFSWLHYKIIILGLIFDVRISLSTTNSMQTCDAWAGLSMLCFSGGFAVLPHQLQSWKIWPQRKPPSFKLRVNCGLCTDKNDWLSTWSPIFHITKSLSRTRTRTQYQNWILQPDAHSAKCMPLCSGFSFSLLDVIKSTQRNTSTAESSKIAPWKVTCNFFSVRRKFCLITNGAGALHRLGDSGEVTEVSHRVGRR